MYSRFTFFRLHSLDALNRLILSLNAAFCFFVCFISSALTSVRPPPQAHLPPFYSALTTTHPSTTTLFQKYTATTSETGQCLWRFTLRGMPRPVMPRNAGRVTLPTLPARGERQEGRRWATAVVLDTTPIV